MKCNLKNLIKNLNRLKMTETDIPKICDVYGRSIMVLYK